MKKSFFALLIVGVLSLLAMSFVPSPPAAPEKFQYGFRKAVTLTSSTAITVAPDNYTLTVATLPLDTNATVNASVAKSIIGDRIILKITADGTTRQIDFTGNITAPDDSVNANKTKLFEFIYDGSKFVELCELQIN